MPSDSFFLEFFLLIDFFDQKIVTAIKQLTAWKTQFNDKLHQVQEEILVHITQKPIAVEEMVRNCFISVKSLCSFFLIHIIDNYSQC